MGVCEQTGQLSMDTIKNLYRQAEQVELKHGPKIAWWLILAMIVYLVIAQ